MSGPKWTLDDREVLCDQAWRLMRAGVRVYDTGRPDPLPLVEIKDHQSFGPKWHRFAVTVADLVVWTGDDPRDVPTEKYRELLEYVLYSAPSGTMSLGQMIRILA